MPIATASAKFFALRMVEMLRKARSVKRGSKELTAWLMRVKLCIMTTETALEMRDEVRWP